MSSETVRVYIEIEKHSNQKYEFNKTTNKLELDRVLPYPYFYPYAYGFIENTLAMDGDEL
jgi:inorganic pyrophosphatase